MFNPRPHVMHSFGLKPGLGLETGTRNEADGSARHFLPSAKLARRTWIRLRVQSSSRTKKQTSSVAQRTGLYQPFPADSYRG
jgi:hypothetical protein